MDEQFFFNSQHINKSIMDLRITEPKNPNLSESSCNSFVGWVFLVLIMLNMEFALSGNLSKTACKLILKLLFLCTDRNQTYSQENQIATDTVAKLNAKSGCCFPLSYYLIG